MQGQVSSQCPSPNPSSPPPSSTSPPSTDLPPPTLPPSTTAIPLLSPSPHPPCFTADQTCAAELREPLQRVFNLSLELGKVPTLWKTSCIIPVPKKNRPNELNDFRPVALTSHLMKTLERLFLNLLRPQVQHAEDSLQFAYRDKVGVEDAIIYMLHRVHSHLDKGSGTARILFLDFSSAFNTIQPLVLQDKLLQMRVDPCLVAWISSYLTDRPQSVRMKDITSDTGQQHRCSTGDCAVPHPLHSKFADDTAIVGCIRDDEEEEYWCLVRDFVAWCHNNGLQLNTSKTKELVIDFGRDRPRPRPVQIGTEEVQTYKYLGLWLDNRLDWTSNTRQLYKKTQSRMYFLRRLRSFNICRKLLWMFYQSVVASILSYAVVCWGGGCDKSGALQAGEADQAGQLGGGDEAETSGDSGREENY
ncbi:hypothetical protein D4764_0109520 [Takifugu flavidus]|uniref:Reverse transcriptase domain-containing protein n=1 Tax=Takifugu flavidus TaxID=433684 RepID=A0A5C6MID7_9TELE|nr:hypothetical protein D4764_0109520 [Takifugu flavidus]